MSEPKKEVTMFFAVTPEVGEEFFTRCLEKEAVTPEERFQIMQDLIAEKKVLAAGTLEPKIGEACQEFFNKTKHRGVILLKEKSDVSDSTNDNNDE